MSVMSWLMEGDPAIRWQVMRDLRDEAPKAVAAERARVAAEGWGARILRLQRPGGWWGRRDERPTWLRTMDHLVLLKDLGADPKAKPVRRALDRVRRGVRWWPLDGRPFFDGETEACINGAILAAGSYFGEDVDRLAARLLEDQLPDGGWNCDAPPSEVSSFHSTIRVLEGLLEYEKAGGRRAAVSRPRRRGEEYLLRRRLLRGARTGRIVDRKWLRFSFPPGWHYDVLRGLDYFRSAGVAPDPRLAEALDVVEARRHQNGRWPLNVAHADRRYLFDMEPEKGKASRWITLRALRVLQWAGRSGSPRTARR